MPTSLKPLVMIVAVLFGYHLLGVAGSLAFGRTAQIHWRTVRIGYLRVLRIVHNGTEWEVGLLPLGYYLTPGDDLRETSLTLPGSSGELWSRSDALEAARGQSSWQNISRFAGKGALFGLVQDVAMILLGVLLCGWQRGQSNLARHWPEYLDVWPPLTRGADHVLGALAELASLPLLAAVGVILVRVALTSASMRLLTLLGFATRRLELAGSAALAGGIFTIVVVALWSLALAAAVVRVWS